MINKTYILRYLPLFEKDLIEITNYIKNVLQNESAALKLVDDVENAILKRLDHPTIFASYRSKKVRKDTYYTIHVHNFIVFYVVIDNVMEVRRLMYGARNIDNYL